jgi:hypothetical protein
MKPAHDIVIAVTLTIPSDTPFMRVAKGVSLLANHIQPAGAKITHRAGAFRIDITEPQEQAA